MGPFTVWHKPFWAARTIHCIGLTWTVWLRVLVGWGGRRADNHGPIVVILPPTLTGGCATLLARCKDPADDQGTLRRGMAAIPQTCRSLFSLPVLLARS